MIIKPKTGKIITFSGSEHEHEVFEVKNGNRYTIAAWYGNDDSSNINSQSAAYKKAIQDQQEYKNG